ncbi:MAG: alpha amylase C-terminal domain-containing protein, partial [Pseudomonadota bacterium]
GDDVVVVVNGANRAYERYRVGLPRGGAWQVRFNGDWQGYGADFGGQTVLDTWAHGEPKDGLGYSGEIGLGAYAAVILTQTG